MDRNYIDYVFRNYSVGTDSMDMDTIDTDSSINQYGGQIANSVNRPTGGFPPIYLCEKGITKKQIVEEEDKRKREYETHKTAISIKDIMGERREVTPFISLI